MRLVLGLLVLVLGLLVLVLGLLVLVLELLEAKVGLLVGKANAIVVHGLLTLGRGRPPDRTIVTTCRIGLISSGVRMPAVGGRSYSFVRSVLVGQRIDMLLMFSAGRAETLAVEEARVATSARSRVGIAV